MNQRAQWDGDVLGRKPDGDFLYKLIVQRYAAHHSEAGTGALCLAIDAPWGAGKTYFVKRWAEDIRNLQHPVICFDAWVNDLADDPLLGFMSQFQKDLEPLINKLPLAKKVRIAGQERFKQVLAQAPGAVLPALKVLGKGLFEKLTNVEADELLEALTEGDLEVNTKAVKEHTAEGMKKFMELALASHNSKQASIKELKRSIEGLLQYLAEQQQAALPMFVIIDELDRCRPDFALRLLEGIKHLFDAQGVCFVFSTNLDQLKESARAVYGPGFDGYRYLKRFFAFEYQLSEPDNLAFAKLLTSRSALSKRNIPVFSGLPPVSPTSRDGILASNFAIIASAFRLNLRSQEQVFRLADDACAGLPEDSSLYCLYMFFLAAVRHEGHKLFESMGAENHTLDIFKDLHDEFIRFTTADNNGEAKSDRKHLREIIAIYFELSRQTSEKMSRSVANLNTLTYPDVVRLDVIREFTVPRRSHPAARREHSALASYHALVRTAGQVKA